MLSNANPPELILSRSSRSFFLNEGSLVLGIDFILSSGNVTSIISIGGFVTCVGHNSCPPRRTSTTGDSPRNIVLLFESLIIGISTYYPVMKYSVSESGVSAS